MITRKYKISKMYEVQDIGGNQMLLPVFRDLDEKQLADQFFYYLDKDDFEYLEQIVAEATLRGIRFTVKNKSNNTR